jgi:hypothetical protein
MKFETIRQETMQTVAGATMAIVLGLPLCYGAEAETEERSTAWKMGGEIDVLPFATKGYYGSVFAGHSGWRFRGVAARSTTPSFMVSSGFRDKRTDAYAVLADRFLGARRQNLEGFWIGGGGEYWRNRIRTNESSEFAHYGNFVLTLGGGYVWKFSKHFYINPWAGAHFVVTGSRDIPVSGTTYHQSAFTPEVSIKLGFTR